MFFTKSSLIVLFLALFLTFVNAAPLRRRSACKPKQNVPTLSAPSVASVTPSAAVQAVTGGKASSATKGADEEIATGKSASATATASSSSVKASSTSGGSKSGSSSSSSSSNSKSLLPALFPVSDTSNSWSTSTHFDDPSPLSDATFRPTKAIADLAHPYVSAPDGKKAMKAHYPKGSYTFGHSPQGGVSFYAPGPSSVDLETAKEATFGYSVYFPEGFEFNKGGKLPGLYGGNSDDTAVSCSGGRRSTECFSARLMWRTDGKGEFYTYLPDYTNPEFAVNKKQCNVAPESDCNPTYGASVGRGSFSFATGKWTTVSERVRLNDVGEANGELELFVGGKSVVSVAGLKLRDASGKGKFRGIQMQTFFGGSDSSWASPKDQDVFFSDFSVAITEKL